MYFEKIWIAIDEGDRNKVVDAFLSEFSEKKKSNKRIQKGDTDVLIGFYKLKNYETLLFTILMSTDRVHDPLFEPVTIINRHFNSKRVICWKEDDINVFDHGRLIFALYTSTQEIYGTITQFIDSSYESEFPRFEELSSYDEDQEFHDYYHATSKVLMSIYPKESKSFDPDALKADISELTMEWRRIVKGSDPIAGGEMVNYNELISSGQRKSLDTWRFSELFWSAVDEAHGSA